MDGPTEFLYGKSYYVWILDNGHGGIINGVYQTKGKRSPVWPDHRQLFEGAFNRDIVRRLSELLKNDIDHIILVPELEDISLIDRVERANIIYKDHPTAILISIHANAGGGTGYEINTSKGETKSDKIAPYFVYPIMTKYFPEANIRKDMIDGDIDKEANYYIIRYTDCPAVLPEHFFMDNYEDCQILLSNEGREKIAMALYEAILNIEKEKPI